MLNSGRFQKLIIFVLTVSLLLTGCWRGYKPDDDKPDDSGKSRTFVISDTYPYPGKDHIISDKEVGKKYDLYVYITNPSGANVKEHEAKNIDIKLIDNTNKITVNIAENRSIPEGKGYLVIEDLSYDREAEVHINVQGTIIQNKKQINVSVNSNKFLIKKSGSETPPEEPETDGLMIWEKEFID